MLDKKKLERASKSLSYVLRHHPDSIGLQLEEGGWIPVDVDLGYEPATPPNILFHGTAKRSLESILRQGLIKGSRHHVHLSTNRKTMWASRPTARQAHVAGHRRRTNAYRRL